MQAYNQGPMGLTGPQGPVGAPDDRAGTATPSTLLKVPPVTTWALTVPINADTVEGSVLRTQSQRPMGQRHPKDWRRWPQQA